MSFNVTQTSVMIQTVDIFHIIYTDFVNPVIFLHIKYLCAEKQIPGCFQVILRKCTAWHLYVFVNYWYFLSMWCQENSFCLVNLI